MGKEMEKDVLHMSRDARIQRAIAQACRDLRKRHKLEEGAHGPAIAALGRAYVAQGAELKVKVDELQQELAQSYRAQANLSEQLVAQVTASQNYQNLLSDKEILISQLQEELSTLRVRLKLLEEQDDSRGNALDVAVHEISALREQLEDIETKLSKAELDNKMLVDRWMEQKMTDAEKLNEANAMYEDMMDRLKGNRLEELARRQVDGIVRHSEVGAELYVTSGVPSLVQHKLQAHEGGCSALAFEYKSRMLISGGNDRLVRSWDTVSGTGLSSLRGCLGSVLDLAVSQDNTLLIAACSDHKLYLWDHQLARIKHTLTGHTEKVCAVDLIHSGNKRAVSSGSDRTIKIWDLVSGYGLNTIVFYSVCNSLCVTSDGSLICSGHMDGNLRFWDIRSGKLAHELAAHGQSITSVSLARSGNAVLTSGRDNLNNIFDVRTLEIKATFRSPVYRVTTNWSRSCLSPDERYIAAGSADGTIVIWSIRGDQGERVLKGGHNSPVLACAWSDSGRPLASVDKNGTICIWE